MPRFYFNHLAQDGARQVDPQGLTLPSLHQALDEATFAARCAAALADEPIAGCYEIENEQRAVIARVPYYIDPDAESEAA